MSRHKSLRRGPVLLTYAPMNQQWWLLFGKGDIRNHSILERHDHYNEAKRRFDYITEPLRSKTRHSR